MLTLALGQILSLAPLYQGVLLTYAEPVLTTLQSCSHSDVKGALKSEAGPA